MWIKKIDYSLYISLLLQMIFSSLISLGLYILIISVSNYYAHLENQKVYDNQKEEIEFLVEEIRKEVASRNLTLYQADFEELDEYPEYDLEFYALDDNELENFNYYQSNNYIFSIAFADQEGFIILESEVADFNLEDVQYIAVILSCILFFFLSLRIIFNLVSYIKVIESGVKKFVEDDISYKIPVIGKNELARLAKSVNEIKAELHQKTMEERENELQQRMLITNISHDLRTPLTSIVGYLDVAKKSISHDSEPYQHIAIAEKNALRLEKLIADLFLYSKILSEDIKMDMQNVNVNLLLNQIIELKPKTINFSSNLPEANFSLDIENFHRIIDNLLDNAIKYGIKDKEISLKAYNKDNELVVEVINYTDDDLSSKIDMLAKRLYTFDENRKQGSSGLGLSIVAELAKRMNGIFRISYNNGLVSACVYFKRS